MDLTRQQKAIRENKIMRKRHFVILVAVVCFVMPFFVSDADAKSGARVKRVPKRTLAMAVKAVGGFAYNAKLNRWECTECTNAAGDPVTDKHPVIFKPVLIGKQKVPAYYEAGNMMADPCDRSYIIITDQSYAIVISIDCGGDSEALLNRYAKSFSLPKGVHALRAKEGAGWQVID
jgi:hypothetical protein